MNETRTVSRCRVAAGGAGTFALSMSVCAFALGTLTGTVTDQAAQKPIAGAFVVANWSEERGFEDESACVWIDVAITDADGRYRISPPLRETVPTSLGNRSITLHAFKAGFWCRNAPGGTNTTPSPEQICEHTATRPAHDQLAFLHQLQNDATCAEAPVEQKRKLLPLYRAAFGETQSLTPPEQYRVNLSGLCFTIAEALGMPARAMFQLTPEDEALIGREEPGCLQIFKPSPPKIKTVILAPPNSGGGGSAAPAAPPK